jgi:hypothetical protein
VLEELFTSGGINRNDEFYFEVEFIKVLTDSAEVADVNRSHVFKVLTDAVTTADITSLDFTVGIYEDEDDTTETTDVFDRVVQYVREVNETTITAENAITDFGKVLQDAIFLQDPYAEDFFDENYVAADTTEFDFGKVIAEAAITTESQAFDMNKTLTDTVTNADTFARTVEYYRTFTESVIADEYRAVGLVRETISQDPHFEDDLTETHVHTSESSTNHLYKYLTESVTSTDTVGIIPYLVKTDDAGATELLIVANDSATIESIAAAEQSLINTLKGLFETVTVTEDGIVNTQNYVDGDFGSDYVGQVTYFN